MLADGTRLDQQAKEIAERVLLILAKDIHERRE
jgi:hypothetical protein